MDGFSDAQHSNRFNLADLRLPENYGTSVSGRKILARIGRQKPFPDQWFRTRGEGWQMPVYMLDLKSLREQYMVDPKVAEEIPDEVAPFCLITTISRQGNLSLWPIRLAGADGRMTDWQRTAFQAATMAESRWIRIRANMSAQAYDIFESDANLPDPNWPEGDFASFVELAFRDHLISEWNDPVLQRLRGEL